MAVDPLPAPAPSTTDAAPPSDTGRIYLEDPKKFYRLLDGVLAATETGRPRALEACVGEFFESVRRDRWLRGAVLYRERRGQFEPAARFGAVPAPGGTPLPADDPLLAELHADAVCYLAARDRSERPWIPDAPAAAVLIAEPHARWMLVLVLSETFERPVVDFVLGTLRSVLSARILQNRWRHALTEAAEIQRGVLPAQDPRFAGFDVAGRSLAAEEVGGDLFGYFALGEDTLGVCIGDASGHGLPAALVARDVLIGLRMGVEKEWKVTHSIEKLNRVIAWGGPGRSFVSLFYGELDADGTLFWINAGHCAPLHVGRWQSRLLHTGDPVLGPIPDARFTRRVTPVEPGDVVVLYTDGLTERQDREGDLFGEARIEALVRENRDGSAGQILEAVLEAVRRFGGTDTAWEDDATLVVVKRSQEGPAGA